MKNLKRLLGLMAISGFAFGFAGNVNAATPEDTCTTKKPGSVAYVSDANGVHCFSGLVQALEGVRNDIEEGGTNIKVTSNDIYLFKDVTWDAYLEGQAPLDFTAKINLNDHNITIGANAAAGMKVLDDGNITINGTGKILVPSTATALTANSLVTVEDGGAFATTGKVTIDFTGKTGMTAAAMTVNGGKLTLSKDTVVKATPKDGISITGDGSTVETNADITTTNSGIVITGTNATLKVTNKLNAGDFGIHTSANANITLNADVTSGNSAVTVAAGVTSGNVNITGGSYTAKTGAALNAVGDATWNITGGNVTADKGRAMDITAGDVTIGEKAGTFTAAGHVVAVEANSTASLTIKGGTFTTNYKGAYALELESAKATYAISGGTFNSAKGSDGKQLAGINFTALDDETLEDYTGILTGGRYLTAVISDPVKIGVNTWKSAEDILKVLVKEGYQVTEDGKYKVITAKNASTEPTTPGTTDKPGTSTGDDTPSKNPGTYDGIMSYVTLAISSLGALGFATKKVLF